MLPFFLHPQRSLSANLFWRFFFLSLPLLIAGGVIVSIFSQQQIQKEASGNLAVIAAEKAGKIETYARGKLKEIEFIASQPYMPKLLAPGGVSSEKQALFLFLQSTGDYGNFYLFSADGRPVFAQDNGDASNPELTRTIDRTRTLLSAEISNYTPDPVTGIPAVYVSAPVFGPKGSISGVVAARLSNEEIYHIVNDYSNLGRTGETVIAQAEGDRIVIVAPLRHLPDAAFHLKFSLQDAPAAILESVEGMRAEAVTADYRGKKTLSVSRYLPSLGWGLVVKMDADEIFAPAASLQRVMWTGSVILVLLFGLIAQISAHSLNRPLSVLTEAARKIEQGDLSTRVSLSSRQDEFSYLAQTFNAMIGQIQDVTSKLLETNESLEQKVTDRTQDLEIKTVEAERANRAKSEFLANMSHEIRTPLNAILGYAQILFRDAALHPFARDAIGTIIKSSDHMLRLINEILDLSKIDAGRMEFQPVDFNLKRLSEEMEDLFLPACEAKGLGLRVQSDDEGRALSVHGDEGKVRQVLINLIGNAVKFTARGSVRVSIRRKTGDQIAFEVADTGPGILPAERERIFEPFYQGSSATGATGTGLGLAIARKQVEIMGGELLLESPREGGTCFRFTLPLPPARQIFRDLSRQVDRLAPGYHLRALVVDDIHENREVLSILLEGIGCEVRLAPDGPQAIEAVRASRFDVVFMDMRLPGMNGLETIRHILALPGAPAPKIIAVSASALEHEKELYLQQGCDGFVAKPVRAERVFAALAELLQVTFLYRPIDAADPESLFVDLAGIPLPEALVDRMVVAAELHSATVLKRCLKEVEELGPAEKRLAAHLRDFLSSCDMTAIQGIIAQLAIKTESSEAAL